MKNPIHILIIEDNEDDAILEIDELRNGGFKIEYERIESSMELKEALKNKTWDCIISDYSMPQFSGLDALAELKETGMDIPFILISGAIGEETAVKAMKAGAHDYIMKNELSRLVPALERELREAEIRRQKHQAEEIMRFERIRLRTLIDNIPDLIYFKDTDCRFIVANQADIGFMGLHSENEIVGKSDLEILKNDFGKRSHAADLAVIQSGSPILNSEEDYTDPTGNQRWFLTSKIPIYDQQGLISGLVGIAHDITDRKKTEFALMKSEQDLKKQNQEFQTLNKEYQTLNNDLTASLDRIKKMNMELVESKNKAEESDNLKTAFLANMSHEIRTPLNAILGFSAFLKNPDITRESTEQFVDIIEASGQQLLTIISDILEISQIEAGHIKIAEEPVNISKILNELFVQFNKTAVSKNIELILNINKSSEDIVAITDGNRMRQVLSNLLNNAIKFTSNGRVEFAARIKNNKILFYVKDTGIGIAPEDQSVIFYPFRQVETTMSRNYGGNGLGLAISKALVEKLKGKMTLTSRLNKGSKFTFTIPYVPADAPIGHHPFQKIPDLKYNWENHIIMVVEDEIYNYRYIEELLSSSHVKILHAKSGKEAVQLVEEHPEISLVIMDLKLPEMDGYKATSIIKNIRPQLPVIAQTATVLNENKDLNNAGFDEYLAKPIERQAFMEVIDDYLD